MEKWKNELKEQMDGFRMDPPEGLWDSIEEKAGRQKAAATPWLRYTAIAAAVAIFAGSGLFLTRSIRDTEKPEIAVAVAPVPEAEKDNVAVGLVAEKPAVKAGTAADVQDTGTEPGKYTGNISLENQMGSTAGTARLAENTVSASTGLQSGTTRATSLDDKQAKKRTTDDVPAKTVILDSDAEDNILTAAKDVATEENTETPAAKDGSDELPAYSDKDDFPDGDDLIEIHESRQRRGRLAGNISFSGTPGSSNSHSGYSEALVSRSALSTFSFGNDQMADIATYNTGQEINTQYHHYQPVRIGISVKYSAGRLLLESGIAYSCLYSRLRSGSERYYYTGSQQLHYIGIPLNIGCNIWDNGRLAVYISAGGTLEKCLGGSLKTDYSYNGAPGTTQHDKLSIRPLQWSVQAAAGLQYNFTNLVSLYMEPGISYHFKNGSTIQSIYTDRPLNFSLTLGLRFNIL